MTPVTPYETKVGSIPRESDLKVEWLLLDGDLTWWCRKSLDANGVYDPKRNEFGGQ